MPERNPQMSLLKKFDSAYGGELLKTRKGRSHGRPLVTKETMHLVLRSSRAKGEWSFRKPQNERCISEIVAKFARKYGVKILSMANVGNHLHLHLKLGNRFTYNSFIRAVSGAIAMAVTGINRWTKIKQIQDDTDQTHAKLKFWDYRPFTRVVQSFRAFLNVRDYVRVNQLEGFGVPRFNARILVEQGVFLGLAPPI